MGARGRVPSRARRPAGRPARVGAASRALARRRSASPVRRRRRRRRRPRRFRPSHHRSRRARRGRIQVRSARFVGACTRGVAERSDRAPPIRARVRSVVARRDAARCRLRCVARSVLPGWESGRAGCTVGSRCAPGGCSCARAGWDRCTCTYRGPVSRVAAGARSPSAGSVPGHASMCGSRRACGWIQPFRAVEWQASAYRSCTGPRILLDLHLVVAKYDGSAAFASSVFF
jgi:hypothetical protein